ncbi:MULTISPECIES: aminotransferase class III-fold pyridoxal phosphate-dependent enzyme [unclassified Saccharothrix]|uniref:aminotransferase class III-fold pyridoxal phosphate-dependent enzyme n=1 Tax=unclassified Saccharothrix TaxID=2593673 RepID=UPI00307CECEE
MDLDELVFHPWVAQGPRHVPTIVAGEGSHVVAGDGRRYLDFSSQLVFTNLGHQHPKVVAAIKVQADRLCTLAPAHANDVRGEAARLIVEVAPEGLGHVLFTTGGTEGIEHAVRMARLVTGRPKVLAAYRSYHGSTSTSIHLTGDPRRWASDTGMAGVVHFFGPFLYRSVFGAMTPEDEGERALAHLEQVILQEGRRRLRRWCWSRLPAVRAWLCRRWVTCAGCGSFVRGTGSFTLPMRF